MHQNQKYESDIGCQLLRCLRMHCVVAEPPLHMNTVSYLTFPLSAAYRFFICGFYHLNQMAADYFWNCYIDDVRQHCCTDQFMDCSKVIHQIVSRNSKNETQRRNQMRLIVFDVARQTPNDLQNSVNPSHQSRTSEILNELPLGV